ncbi:hypothetical protein V6Z12_D07G128800 [Gossypium hirsutum]
MIDLGLMKYFLGLEVRQEETGIFMSQEAYAKEILKKYKMAHCNPVSTPMEPGVKLSKFDGGERVDASKYWSLVGSLRYLTCTRPYISLSVGIVSRFMEEPVYSHWKALKRILRYIQGTVSLGLFYSNMKYYKLIGYSDSDWCGDLDNRKSTSAYVFFMGNTAFAWLSKKQPVVTLLTCEAKYVAASWCVCHAIWLRNLLGELEQQQLGATEKRVDNKSEIELAKNPVNHERSKHIDIRFHFIRDHVKEGSVKLLHVASRDRVADIFTKPLPMTGKLLREADKESGHKKTITSLTKSADGSHFLTGSLDKSAKLWDTRRLTLIKTYVTERPVNAVAMSPLLDHRVSPRALCKILRTWFALTLRRKYSFVLRKYGLRYFAPLDSKVHCLLSSP